MYSGANIGANINGNSGFSVLTPQIKPIPATQWNIQSVRGKVTVRCLWQACKALLIGLLLIMIGAAMATVGYYADELAMEERQHGNTTAKIKNPTKVFHLNNLTYVGPIIMGCGGFVIVAAVVMTFEARDSAVKIVPARFRSKLDNTVTSNGNCAGTGAATLRACYHDANANDSFDRTSYAPSSGGPVLPPEVAASRLAVTGAFLRFSRSLRGSSVESGDSSAPCSSSASHPVAPPPSRNNQPPEGALRRCPSAPALMSEFQTLRNPNLHDQRATSRQQCQLLTPDIKRLQVSLLPRQALSMDNSGQVYHSQHYSGDSEEEDDDYDVINGNGTMATTAPSEVDLEIGTSALSMQETDSESSMTMDLHFPDCPVTLTVKDESKRQVNNGERTTPSPNAAGSPRSPTAAAVSGGTSPRSPHPNVRFQTGTGKGGPTAGELGRRETGRRRPLLRQTKVEHVDDDIFDPTVSPPPGHTPEDMYRNAGDFPRSTNEDERQANIRRASKLDDEFKNPCSKEMKQSYKCLEDNHYNRKVCEIAFHNYKRCREFWSKIAYERRTKGITPEMPWPEEREEIKRKHFSSRSQN